MHIIITFINIGSYHATRLQAAHKACQERGWQLTAVQVTDDTLDHDWGDFVSQLSIPVKTLLPVASQLYDTRRDTFTSVADEAFKHCLNELQPDAVVLPGWSFSVARAGLKWCRRSNTLPILMSETKEDDAPRFWWQEVIKSWIVKRYKAALVGGNPHKRYLMKLGMPSSAIFMGYDIVGNDIFHPQKIKSLPAPLKKPYFLAINRFIPKKNLEFLISSYAAYRQVVGINCCDLVLCGDGNLLPQIKQQIVELGLKNCIHLPGFLKEDELLPYFAHANCFIHTSIQEQWGLVVNEAMAAGLPVLVSNRCGCFEDLVLEGINGFGFDPENYKELTQLMIKMNSDEVDLQAMSKASLEHIQKFSPNYFGQGLLQAVEYALAHC
ncbi:glycosyltransferase family 4 protein [Dendronalium sp. ChiSLP03b]|uniref:glycosyltransferase family 4 protein n=1 Tax=Dendronalium sp. ChiSLP03b TaxID=3075381 RepID=UPI002AD2F45A|nr:glycosyltransferase family 4 protein [Dendronalium sp. ChiSLP03b]MDZ8204880.1 glycosyltransferase family 4 protein [Dendronalium sp. ChiSLP03b]